MKIDYSIRECSENWLGIPKKKKKQKSFLCISLLLGSKKFQMDEILKYKYETHRYVERRYG